MIVKVIKPHNKIKCRILAQANGNKLTGMKRNNEKGEYLNKSVDSP